MAGQSKEAGELTPKQKSKIILRHALLQLICLCLPGQSEVQLFTDLCQGDANRAAQLLSITMSMSGAVEFFVGPTIGKLSDSIGRKPFFFGYPLYGMVAWTAMALFPENLVICCVGRTLGWSMVTWAFATRTEDCFVEKRADAVVNAGTAEGGSKSS